MENQDAIQVNHVTKCYRLFSKNADRVKEALDPLHRSFHKDYFALKDVRFSVKKGETVGIIGKNGSGKSTILKILTGITTPTEGSVHVEGKVSALLELGAGFNPEYTGRENIFLNGMMMNYSREQMEERAPSIIEFADIGEFIDQPVKTYSSGMFVRLAFAVAINVDPDVLIVDEALSVGDVFFQAKCYKKFEEFKKQGKTILIVSHDLGSISKYCDRVVLLNVGGKIAEGNPKEMIDLYKKILVGMERTAVSGTLLQPKEDIGPVERWSSKMHRDTRCDEYGTMQARIEDFAIVDHNGVVGHIIRKGELFSIRIRVTFQDEIDAPIYAFAIKTIKGTTVAGTNSAYEGVDTGIAKAGETYVIEYQQKMSLQGGDYLLSLGCTGYVAGKLTVYHRLYDVCSLTVISEKPTDGFFDMYPQIHFEKIM